MFYFVENGTTYVGIVGAQWSVTWYDYGDGWYYLAVGSNTWVTVSANGYISATFNTDDDNPSNAGTIFLAPQGGGKGGGSGKG